MQSIKPVNKGRYLLIFAMSLMAFIFNADYLAVNLAMQSIIADFHSSLDVIQWILSGYMLSWSILVIPSGKLLESHSTKRIAIIGVVILMMASAFAGLSYNALSIIITRMLQGGGAAIFLPACYAMMFYHFEENERGKVMGVLSLAVGIGLSLGPVLGGILLASYGWRSIFFINIPIAFLVIGIIYLFDSAPAPQSKEIKKIDKVSFALLSGILPGILWCLSQYSSWAAHAWLYVIAFSFIFIATVIFSRLQGQLDNPLVPFSVFKNRQFLGCCIGIFILEFVFSGIVVSFGDYLQDKLQLSAFSLEQ